MMLHGIDTKAAMGATFGLEAVFLLPVLIWTGAPLFAGFNNFTVGLYMSLVPMFIGYVAFGYGLARDRQVLPLPNTAICYKMAHNVANFMEEWFKTGATDGFSLAPDRQMGVPYQYGIEKIREIPFAWF